ncbi:MAG: hypothetical protein FJ033_14080 [Chloroflexi bacterium]|nr:hypothetical protein [Chloroflexota bacterium]
MHQHHARERARPLRPRDVGVDQVALSRGVGHHPRLHAHLRVGLKVVPHRCPRSSRDRASGCALGHRNLRLLDHGKVALTLVDRATRRAVRVWPREDARERAALWPAADAWHAQRNAYREMEAGALLRGAEVPPRLPEALAALVGSPGAATRLSSLSNGRRLLPAASTRTTG